MLDPATIFLGLALHAGTGKPYERPRYDTPFSCALALMLAKPELEKLYLDPKRFKCDPDGEHWVVRGKMRGEP